MENEAKLPGAGDDRSAGIESQAADGSGLDAREAAQALGQVAAGQREMRASVAPPTWFILSISAVVGVVCAVQALPVTWARVVVYLVLALELVLLGVRFTRLRGVKAGWTWRQVGLAVVGGALAVVALLLCTDGPLRGSAWAAAVGFGLWAALSLVALVTHRVESRRNLADA
ncbi:MAG: hypothetical protein LBK54_05305 [Propionibacteriaceae bacterium]|jgi:hypothetical protein|nr:hypothetical protein [Propionibacteriaceae bacterium]